MDGMVDEWAISNSSLEEVFLNVSMTTEESLKCEKATNLMAGDLSRPFLGGI